MKLSERLEAAREALDSMDDFARMEVSIDPIGPRKVLADFIEAAAELARSVEDAPCVPVIDGGRMIRPFRQYGRFDIPDDGENPATKEARLLGQFVGQRVRLVPEAGQGGGDG